MNTKSLTITGAVCALALTALTGCAPEATPDAAPESISATPEQTAPAPSHKNPDEATMLKPSADVKNMWGDKTTITQSSEGDTTYVWKADETANNSNNQVVLIFPAPEKCIGTGDTIQQAIYDLPFNAENIYDETAQKYGNPTYNQRPGLATGNWTDATVTEEPQLISMLVKERKNPDLMGENVEMYTQAYKNKDGQVETGSCSVVFGDYLSGDVTTYNNVLDEARQYAKSVTLDVP